MKMNKIVIIVIVIIAIIVLCGLIYFILRDNSKVSEMYYIKGGEGPGIINYRNKIPKILSFSEQAIQQIHPIQNIKDDSILTLNQRDLRSFDGLTLGKFKEYGTVFIHGNCYLIPRNIEPRYFSDSLFDGIEIMLNNKNVKQIMALNEFPSINLIYPKVNPVCNILGNKGQTELLMKLIDNSETINKFKDNLLIATEELLKILFNDLSPNINNVEFLSNIIDTTAGNNSKYYLENGDEKIKIIPSLSINPKFISNQKFIFIEFSYTSPSDEAKFYIFRLFDEIHKITHETINYIINNSTSNINCIRLVLPIGKSWNNKSFKNVDEFKDKFQANTLKDISINYYVEDFDDNIHDIIIPDTKISFGLDEYLMIQTSNTIYHVQVEHSENGSSHKSNMVEFLMRMWNIFEYDNKSLYDLLVKFNYSLNEFEGKINALSVFNISNKKFIEYCRSNVPK